MKFKRITYYLVLVVVFAQSACVDSCNTNQEPLSQSNTANNSVSTNDKNGNYWVNRSVNTNKIPKGSTASRDLPYSANPGNSSQSGRAPNFPTIENENGSANPPSISPQMSDNGERIANPPIIINNEYYPSGMSAPHAAESLPNTPVMHDLEVAIDRWSEIEAASYGPRATLISLWRRKNPTVKYNPVGIDVLTSRIRERPAFISCERARQLGRAMFHEEGIITVGHLYDYLEPCANR